MSNEYDGLFAAGVMILGVALGLGTRIFGFSRERRIKRALRSVKPTLIRDVRDGKVVKIVGELVFAGRSIEAALSQRACAYYSLRVEEYRGHGPRGGHWREIIREDKGIDFYVRDESGMALVRIASDAKALPALVQDRKARTSPILSDDADLARFMAERGRSVEGSFFRKNLRAYEGVLEAGERVAVGGLARWLPDPDAAGGSYRETPTRLVMQASEAMPLFLSDDPGAL
jgi:hypothetical protein